MMAQRALLNGNKAAMRSSVSLLALLLGVSPAFAQPAAQVPAPVTVTPAPATVTDAEEEIVITGSRVTRNGFNAPTPVTVLSAAELEARADINIADAVNQLPQTANSVTQTSQPTAVSGGALGVNQISLRGLGPTRTLVLLDGKRVINSSITTALAAPNINNIPNGLISRVDIVTGGASAAYGSDALTGVVNFVLDRKFTGLKGELTGGITTYGDNKAYLASLTGGLAFGPEKRGHIVVSGELAFNDGVDGNPRPWAKQGGGIVVNPTRTATNGEPFYLVRTQIGVNNATPGGVITGGPLRGTLFGPNGAVSTYNFGVVAANNAQLGGDWQISRLDDGYDLVAQNKRHVLFGRVNYEFAEAFNLYAEYQWARSRDTGTVNPFRRSGNITIRRDNAFLPESIRAQVVALNLASFSMGSTNADIGRGEVENIRNLKRWAVGADGTFDVLGSTWAWDAYYQRSRNVVDSALFKTAINVGAFNRAVDAVINPATGGIVCRSTLTNPTNGCVPYNVFGIGVNQPAAIDALNGISTRHDVMKQNVAALNFSGEPFSTWAGPVSLAFGLEHRSEKARGEVTGVTFLPTNGAYKVTEGYAETVIPLARDLAWAKSLELNGAVRLTDYSTSGRVTTWKLGATYAPIDDIRFRATRSRDIRAPNIGELFALGQIASGANIVDPFNGNAVYTTVNILRRGNALLKPEVADTLGMGVVVTPTFFSGFQASVDYYKIKINNAVKIPNEQVVVNLCFQDPSSPVCAFIERAGNVPTGAITQISTPPANVLSQDAEGIDFEMAYRLPLSNLSNDAAGALSLRAYGNYVISLKNVDTTGVSQGAGVVGNFGGIVSSGPSAPKFRSTVRLAYEGDRLDASVSWRFVGTNVIDRTFVECVSACPANNVRTIERNRVASNSLFDLALSYKPFEQKDTAVYFAVDNVFNQAPPFVPGQVDIAFFTGQYTIGYDRIGRTFRTGIRFKL